MALWLCSVGYSHQRCEVASWTLLTFSTVLALAGCLVVWGMRKDLI